MKAFIHLLEALWALIHLTITNTNGAKNAVVNLTPHNVEEEVSYQFSSV